MLKKNVLVSTIFAGFVVLSTAASAAAPGFYLEGQLGWSKADYDVNYFTPYATTSDVTNSGVAGRGAAGFQFNQNWAMEAGYTRYANVKYKNFTNSNGVNFGDLNVKLDGFDLVGKGSVPLDAGFNVFGKAGVAYIRAKADNAYIGSSDSTKWRPTFGAGFGYDFNQNVAADISWMRVPSGSSGFRNLDLISAGIGYHFG